MFVNYVREINAFHRYANVNFLGSSERLLWFGLMDYINLHYASGSEWPGDFISIPNKGILSHVPFGEDTLTEARSRLKQRGLIEYLPGKKNKVVNKMLAPITRKKRVTYRATCRATCRVTYRVTYRATYRATCRATYRAANHTLT